MHSIRLAFASAAILSATLEGAYAEPHYRLDSKQERVLELSNLSPRSDCQPALAGGRVVKRNFDKQGIWLTSLTIEEKSGARTYINVDEVALSDASMVAKSWAAIGLQTLIREGRTVNLGVRLCGAAGRVIMLDAVRVR